MPRAGGESRNAETLADGGVSLVLLLGAASVGVPGARERAEWLAEGLGEKEWGEALAWARRLRAEGVLLRAMRGDAPTEGERRFTWPGSAGAEAAHERLTQLAMVADFRQARVRGTLAEALRILEAASIPVMLLKGAALAGFVYRGFPDRPMEDLDVLVQPGDAGRAFDALVREHWKASDGDRARNGDRGGALHHHLPQLRHSESGVVLEIHHSLFPVGHPFAWNEAESWERSSKVVEGGISTRRLGNDELLLHAAIHFGWSHELRVGAWSWMRDLQVLSRVVDPDVFWRQAADRNALTVVTWALRLGEMLAGANTGLREVHAGAPRESAGTARGRYERALARHLFMDAVPNGAAPSSVWLRRRLWEKAIRPRETGYGSSRPWTSLPSAPPGRPGGLQRARGLARSLLREAPRASSWMLWLRRLLG